MRHAVAISLALAALAALGLSACGGGDSGSQITRAEFIKQGDAICAKAGTRVSNGLQEESKKLGGKQLDQKGEERILATITAPAMTQMAEELAALGSPKGEEAEAEAIVSGFHSAAHKLEEEPKAGVEEDPFAKPSGKAGAYGFTACAQF